METFDETRRVQDDVLTRRQLHAYGMGHDVVRSQLRAGRWQVAGPKAVVLHNGPVTVAQRRWIAVLTQGGQAALAGLTAAELLGLSGFGSEDIHVLISRDQRVTGMTGVQVHVSRRFSPADVHPAPLPPVVRIERALLDAAVWEGSARTACGILAAGVQQRLTTAGRLRRELDRAGQVRRCRLLMAVLGDIEGGAHSLNEIDFGPLCRRAGLPPPRRQSIRLDGAGRRRYLDVDCGGFVVELDGALHLQPLTWWSDAMRQNELVIAGARVLRIPSLVYRLDPDLVVDQLRRAAERFGCD